MKFVESELKTIEYNVLIEKLIEHLIFSCENDDRLLKGLISHLDNKMSDDVRNVLSKMRDNKINSILNERS
jgi:hypothetical protein